MPGDRLKWRLAADLKENAGKTETVGKIQRNVEFIRGNDYNGNKEWRKYVGLIKIRVVLKSVLAVLVDILSFD